jgi:hypothetical protein
MRGGMRSAFCSQTLNVKCKVNNQRTMKNMKWEKVEFVEEEKY